MKITIIGGGIMGSTIANALLETKTISAENLTISDSNLKKLESFSQKNVKTTDNNLEAIQNAEIVLIAVKPQMFEEVLSPLKDKIEQEGLVISIAAGVKISQIQKLLNHQKIVRVMPNTPAQISEGFSGWFASEQIESQQKDQVKQILTSFGQETEVENEDQIDGITALSGSGPAYVFLFLQSLIEGGIKLGLSEKSAKKAALKTVLGSVKLASNSTEELETLIENVTSKGGTTAAARAKFTELNFKETIVAAMESAHNRAKELANE